MPDSVLDSSQEIAEAVDVNQAGRGVGESRLQQNMPRFVLAEHVINEIGGHRHLPPGLFLSGVAALDQPRNDGQTLKERFIRLDSASQASKSSPSMSSSKSRGRLRRPSRTIAPRSLSPQMASAYSLATKPSGAPRARSSRRVSSMPRL